MINSLHSAASASLSSAVVTTVAVWSPVSITSSLLPDGLTYSMDGYVYVYVYILKYIHYIYTCTHTQLCYIGYLNTIHHFAINNIIFARWEVILNTFFLEK